MEKTVRISLIKIIDIKKFSGTLASHALQPHDLVAEVESDSQLLEEIEIVMIIFFYK